jgi:hypothetical protein
MSGRAMTGIFICYRRQDSAPYAGRICDRLSGRFGKDAVFMDVDDIAPGTDFTRAIARTLDQARLLLALIGPAWLDAAGPDGGRRLDDPADYVRREIAHALNSGMRVVPLLVGRAVMPAEARLPPDLAPLARLNALEIGDARFEQDMAALIALIEEEHAATSAAAPARAARGRAVWRMGGIAAMLTAAAGAAFWFWHAPPAVPPEALPDPDARFAGTWQARVAYPWGIARDETFRLSVQAGRVSGSAGFVGLERTIVEGSASGERIEFVTRSEEMLSGEPVRALTHRYRGTLESDGTLRLVLQTEGGSNSGGPVGILASRTQR